MKTSTRLKIGPTFVTKGAILRNEIEELVGDLRFVLEPLERFWLVTWCHVRRRSSNNVKQETNFVRKTSEWRVCEITVCIKPTVQWRITELHIDVSLKDPRCRGSSILDQSPPRIPSEQSQRILDHFPWQGFKRHKVRGKNMRQIAS